MMTFLIICLVFEILNWKYLLLSKKYDMYKKINYLLKSRPNLDRKRAVVIARN